MSTPVSVPSNAAITNLQSEGGQSGPIGFMPSSSPDVDTDEDMLPAEQGAAGLVGPVTGAQHVQNPATPGPMTL